MRPRWHGMYVVPAQPCLYVVQVKRKQRSCLNLATALPLGVWQDHLASFLGMRQAGRLQVTCKVLREVLKECPCELEIDSLTKLEAALTCFPAAPSLRVTCPRWLTAAEESKASEVLRNCGGSLERVTEAWTWNCHGSAYGVLCSALRAGALPKLRFLKLSLTGPDQVQLLSDGLLGRIEEVDVTVVVVGRLTGGGEPFAALEHLQRVRLRRLSLEIETGCPEAAFPLFVPPSLKRQPPPRHPAEEPHGVALHRPARETAGQRGQPRGDQLGAEFLSISFCSSP
jgi:hypothetical protein